MLFLFIKGGHTTEMLKLVAELSNRYQPRHYVVADTDAMSTEKLHVMEKNRAQCKGDSLVSLYMSSRLNVYVGP